jgi:hypothetical protein
MSRRATSSGCPEPESLLADEVVLLGGIPATSLARAVADLGRLSVVVDRLNRAFARSGC